MTSIKLTSRPCTDKAQSVRLLSMGIKKETADMTILYIRGEEFVQFVGQIKFNGELKIHEEIVPEDEIEYIPAWTLSRLLEIYAAPVASREYLLFLPDAFDELIGDLEQAIKCGRYSEFFGPEKKKPVRLTARDQCRDCKYSRSLEKDKTTCEIHEEWNPIYEDDDACEDFDSKY